MDFQDELDRILARYPEPASAIISILHEVQSACNYLPEEALRQLAAKTGVPVTRLYSIATFYHFFSLTPQGRHQVHVCLGTACHVKGSGRVLTEIERELGAKEGQTTADMRFSVGAVRCVGACSLAPVMVVDNQTHGKMTPKAAKDILKKYE